MRFMIIVTATPESEAGLMPGDALLNAMADYHGERARAGVLLDASGLHPSKLGWRIRYRGQERSIVDGPFTESKEMIAGYTMISVRTREKRSNGGAVSRIRVARTWMPRSKCARYSSSTISRRRRCSTASARSRMAIRRPRPEGDAMPGLFIIALALALLAAVLVLAARRPDMFRVQRSIHIAAPPERIEPLISDLRRFNTWNPFANNGPLQLTYTGPERGTGAAYDFAGSRAAGRGRLAVVEAAPQRIAMRLTMTAPMRCENEIEFLLAPGVGGTEVTWAMQGRSPFIAKLMALVVDTDRMVGRELETGLAALREQAEMAEAA